MRADMGSLGELFRRFLAGFVDVMASSSVVLGWGHVWPSFKYIAPALPAEEDVKSELASAEEGEAGVAEYIISAHVLRQIIRASAYSPPLIHLRRCPPIWAF